MSSSDARDAATWGVLFGLLGVAVGLLGLMALVAPQVFGVVLVIAGFVSFGALHYLLWGWWLRPRLMERDDAEHPDDDRGRC